MLLGLIIRNQQFPVLAIAPGLIVGDLDNAEVACGTVGFAEDAVHFFERAVRGLRVEEVGYRDDKGVAAQSWC